MRGAPAAAPPSAGGERDRSRGSRELSWEGPLGIAWAGFPAEDALQQLLVFLPRGARNWAGHSRRGLTGAGQRGRITSPDLLDTLPDASQRSSRLPGHAAVSRSTCHPPGLPGPPPADHPQPVRAFGAVPARVRTLNPAFSKPPVIAPASLQDGARGLGTPPPKVECLFLDGLRGGRCPGQPERRVIDARGLLSRPRWDGAGSHPAPCPLLRPRDALLSPGRTCSHEYRLKGSLEHACMPGHSVGASCKRIMKLLGLKGTSGDPLVQSLFSPGARCRGSSPGSGTVFGPVELCWVSLCPAVQPVQVLQKGSSAVDQPLLPAFLSTNWIHWRKVKLQICNTLMTSLCGGTWQWKCLSKERRSSRFCWKLASPSRRAKSRDLPKRSSSWG
ncbi:uncharacterized protein [Chamaea fasciata]|uniref:uncharacterized protein n=1 Tax=Chamaea fasciata TaxID=190680 RepID=UPI00336AC78C